MQKPLQRNNNIEILRIIAMFMIIAGHAITHTDIYDNVGEINFYFVKFFDIVFNVATNVYVVISGYLLCEKTFKIKKVFVLWLQILFYSIIIYLVLILTNQIDFSLNSLVKVIMPISGNQYWFARVYLGLYILSPFLNILIKSLNQKQFQCLLVVLTILFSLWGSFIPFATTLNVEGGNSIIWFCVLYMFAAYIRIYGVPLKSNKALIGLTMSFFVFAFLSRVVLEKLSLMIGLGGKGASQFTTFNSFTMLFGAVGLLCIAVKLPHINKFSKVIQWFSLSTFSVYLIHDNKYLRHILWEFLRIDDLADEFYIVPYILLTSVAIFVVCVCLDKVIYIPLNNFVSNISFKKLQSKIDSYII